MRAAVQIIFIQAFVWGFLILVALPDWGSTRFYTFDLRQTPEEIASAGLSDVSGYVQTGLELAKTGAVAEQNLWRLRLFGPGMTYFYAAVIKVFGNDDLFILRVLIIAIFLWACLLTSFIRHLSHRYSLAHASLALLATLIFAWPGEGMFNAYLLGSDIWALFSFCLGFWCVYRATELKNSKLTRGMLIVVAGLSLSSAMLIAGRYAFITEGLLFVLTGSWVVRLIRQRGRRRLSPQKKNTSMLLLTASVVIAFLATVPWRVYSEQYLRPGSYSLRSSELYWAQRWMPDSYLLNNGIGFLEQGGANWACDLNPTRCQDIYTKERTSGSNYNGTGTTVVEFRTLAIEAAIKKPHLYLQNRLSNLASAWFNFNQPSTSQQRTSQVFGLIASIVCLFRLVGFRTRQFMGQIDLATRIVGITVLVGFLAPYLLYHIEYRYLLPLRFLAIVLFPFLVTTSKNGRR